MESDEMGMGERGKRRNRSCVGEVVCINGQWGSCAVNGFDFLAG